MTLLQDVGAWMVPTSSVDSSGFVPIKSKFRHRTVRPRACSPRIASCLASATVFMRKFHKRGENITLVRTNDENKYDTKLSNPNKNKFHQQINDQYSIMDNQ